MAILSNLPHFFFALQQIAVSTAALCLALILAAMGLTRWASGPSPSQGRAALPDTVIFVALFVGVSSVVAHSVFLAIRGIAVSVEVVQGFPWSALPHFAFGTWGLWSLLAIILSCVLAMRLTGKLPLATCGWWLMVMWLLWAVLLLSPTRRNAGGGFERTGSTLLLLSGLSVVHASGILAACGLLGRLPSWLPGRNRLLAADSGFERSHQMPNLGQSFPPGFVLSAVILAAAIGLIGWFNLLIPQQLSGGGFALGALAVVAAATLTALACWQLWINRATPGSIRLCRGARTFGLGEAVFALGSLALGGLGVLVLGDQPRVLAERFPRIFNVMIVGFAASAAILAWVAASGRIPGLAAISTGASLAGRAGRIVFLNGVLALLAAIMMTVWPRLPGIAAMDDSLGRLTAGLGACLTLLLVTLWASRTLGRLTLHLLTILVLCTTVGFVVSRVLPFASHVN